MKIRVASWILIFVAVVGAGRAAAQFLGDGFTPERWRANRGAEPLENERGGMLVELTEEHIRPGMTRQELLDLLGPADQESSSELSYELGVAAFGVDTEAYVFVFDGQGRLAEHHLIRR